MSYIVRAGNLAGPIKLTLNDDGTHHGRVTVIVNDRAKDPETGKWETVATTGSPITLDIAKDIYKQMTYPNYLD